MQRTRHGKVLSQVPRIIDRNSYEVSDIYEVILAGIVFIKRERLQISIIVESLIFDKVEGSSETVLRSEHGSETADCVVIVNVPFITHVLTSPGVGIDNVTDI